MDKEYICCAAIWFDDGEKRYHQPKGIGTGLVMCGFQHCSIYSQLSCTVLERKNLGVHEKESGFLTSKNRFVDREEGAEIVFAAGQIKEKKHHLFSEDIYGCTKDG